MRKPFYITTPIYYVNDHPHIGHAYTTIAADVLTRFHRLDNREVFFLTGTDEHGTKIAEAAEALGLAPQEFCDRVVAHFKESWKSLSIEYSDFIRTTEPRHEMAASQLLAILKQAKTDKGEDVIYFDEYEGLYCVGCEKFLTEKELVDGVCPDHKKKPKLVKEKNYFFRLTAYLDYLKSLIESDKLRIMPDERRREVMGLFEQGLTDFSISREHVKWGIPLPFDKSQVTYVWVEALMNYLTGIGYGADEQKFNHWWREADITHLMAKEILKFHCIFWPAILLAAKLPLPRDIFLHGFFTIDGQKMSKSLGNAIPPRMLVEKFGADATRYLLLTQYPFGKDGDIQQSKFIEQYNSALANDLGNLVSRVAKMVMANFGGILPGPVSGAVDIREIIDKSEQLPSVVYDHINSYRIGTAIDEIMSLVRVANKFFDTHAPWKMVKDGRTAGAGEVLYACCEVIRIVSILLYPVLPNKSLEILKVLGLDKNHLSFDNARTFFYLKPGTVIQLNEAVFPRLKADEEKPGDIKISGPSKELPPADDGLIDIAYFGKVNMVVARVITAEKIAGADKLLKLHIDTGTDQRQIVAGIAEYYQPEIMVGKKIIIVKNLKPAKIRGIESHGMLLAAKTQGRLCLVTPESDDLPPGAVIG